MHSLVQSASDLILLVIATTISRVCVIASEVIALFATWVKTYRYIKEVPRFDANPNLSTVLLRDGTPIPRVSSLIFSPYMLGREYPLCVRTLLPGHLG